MGQQYINQPQIFQSRASFERGLSATDIYSLSVLTSSISSERFLGNFFGSTRYLNLSTAQVQSLVTSTSGAVFGGTFIGDGKGLEVTYLPQQRDINTFVLRNTATMVVQVLTAQKVHADYFGDLRFPVLSSTAITNAIALSQAVFNGIYYGDGRNLLGVVPGQSGVNNIVASISATPVFQSLTVRIPGTTTLLASAGKVGINIGTGLTQALTVSGSVSATGYIYGDGLYLTNVTTGNRRFDYTTTGGNSYSYSGTTLNSNFTVSQSAWKIVKIQYSIDGRVDGLSGIQNAAWSERYQPWVIYT